MQLLAIFTRILIDNIAMYVVVIIASILIPILAPGLFHTPRELQELTRKKYRQLLRKDILIILSLSLIVSTLMVGFFNSIIKPSPWVLIGCLVAFVIWAIVYISLTIRRRK